MYWDFDRYSFQSNRCCHHTLLALKFIADGHFVPAVSGYSGTHVSVSYRETIKINTMIVHTDYEGQLELLIKP